MPQTCLCQKYPPEMPINLDGLLPLSHTLRRRYEKHKTELNKLKVDKTVIELQLAMTEAKYNYESNLIFKIAHTHHNKIYQYISNIKGQDNFSTQMFYNNQHACTNQEKPNYLTTTFTQYFPLTPSLQSASL